MIASQLFKKIFHFVLVVLVESVTVDFGFAPQKFLIVAAQGLSF